MIADFSSDPVALGGKSRLVSTNGYQTHVYEFGAGPPVILLHGAGAGADAWGNWHKCVPYFAAVMRVLLMDIVGFGRSDAPEALAYSQDDRNDQVISLIEAEKVGPVDIVGNSMGGATALGVAMMRPDLVRRMVVCGSAGLHRFPSANSAEPTTLPATHLAEYDFTREGIRKLIDRYANQDFKPSEELIDYRYRLMSTESGKRGYLRTRQWMRDNGGLFYEETRLSAIETACLVVQGKEDDVVPIEHAYRFLELMRNSSGYFIPSCKHWVMMEQPDLFSAVSLQFLRQEDRPGASG